MQQGNATSNILDSRLNFTSLRFLVLSQFSHMYTYSSDIVLNQTVGEKQNGPSNAPYIEDNWGQTNIAKLFTVPLCQLSSP